MSKIILRDRTIDLEPLDHTSATIKETGYDSDGRILIVKFKNGSVYAYSPILPQAYQALLQAPSAGSYLQQNIVKNKLVNTSKLLPNPLNNE